MVIGSSGRFETHFPPDECGQQLNQDRSADSYVGFADVTGFQLAKYGRTAVRIRGMFTPLGAGSGVEYRVEFIPWMIWALVLAFVVSTPALIVLVWLGYVPVSALAWLVVIVPLTLAVNLWFSERQAQSLRGYVASVLDARTVSDLESRDVSHMA